MAAWSDYERAAPEIASAERQLLYQHGPGLAFLHPDKTRLIEFGRHAARRRSARGVGEPEA